MGKFNLKDQLAGIAALIAAIVAIGGGFVKYGEIMTKLDVLSEQTGPDLHLLHNKLVMLNKESQIIRWRLRSLQKMF